MIFNAFMVVILIIAFLITIVGLLYILRIELDLYFDIDYVEKFKKWVSKKNER